MTIEQLEARRRKVWALTWKLMLLETKLTLSINRRKQK